MAAGDRWFRKLTQNTTHVTATYPVQAAHSRRTTRKTVKARNRWNSGAAKADVNMFKATEVGTGELSGDPSGVAGRRTRIPAHSPMPGRPPEPRPPQGP